MFHNLSGRLRLIINLVSGEIILCLEKCNLKKYSMSGRKQLQLSGRKDYQHSVWKCVSGALCLEENHSRGKCLEKCVWKSAPPRENNEKLDKILFSQQEHNSHTTVPLFFCCENNIIGGPPGPLDLYQMSWLELRAQ